MADEISEALRAQLSMLTHRSGVWTAAGEQGGVVPRGARRQFPAPKVGRFLRFKGKW